jgi:hypothetical protein
MKRSSVTRIAIALLVLTLAGPPGHGCSFGRGYFHQVTALKGTVVGSSNEFAPRWLRRMTKVSDANLTLFEYQSVFPSPIVAKTTTNSSGNFEFTFLKPGHYTLKIQTREHEDYFDVEVTDKVTKTSRVLIDISPVEPDCTGGHEFEVYAERK